MTKPLNYDIKYLEELDVILRKVKLESYKLIPRNEEGVSIVDVGCGDGSDCRRLSKILPASSRIFGLDQYDSFIDEATQLSPENEYPNVKFLIGVADQLPFEDNSMDVVRFERVFQHLQRPQAVMNEAMRVLKRNEGKIIIIETDWLSISFGTRLYEEERKITDEKLLKDLNNGLACQSIADYIDGSGFEVFSLSNFITSVNSFEKADYVTGAARSISRLEQEKGEDFSLFMEEVRKQESLGAFSFCWTTKIFEIGRN